MKPLLDVDVPSPPPGFPADPLERSPGGGAKAEPLCFVFAYRVSPGWLHTQAPDRERYSLTHCRLCGGKGEEVK
ncbi:unnamed protein product [Arctogadus glacialis]